jgi:hypothetical protein
VATGSSSKPGYLQGVAGASSSLSQVYLTGGAEATPDSVSAFLSGREAPISSLAGYLKGQFDTSSFVQLDINAFKSAYMTAVVRSSISVYMGAETMTQAYIELRNSDSSLDLKFRVIAANYDDGALTKAQRVDRTIGGGLDVSDGGIYKEWNPTVRVRHTETEAGYGTLAELITFYSYTNPNGTPSNLITFTDHHSVEYTIRMLGDFRKALMGVSIEGDQAWSLVTLRLIQVA